VTWHQTTTEQRTPIWTNGATTLRQHILTGVWQLDHASGQRLFFALNQDDAIAEADEWLGKLEVER
jgi:hypothetical protein